MKRLIASLCLFLPLLLLLTGCGNTAPVFHEHEHVYVETHTNGTCIARGYTEYRCHCGVRYTVNDATYGEHTPPVLPTEDPEDAPDSILLKESTDYPGIEGSYCDECGAYLSFERREKTTIHIGNK